MVTDVFSICYLFHLFNKNRRAIEAIFPELLVFILADTSLQIAAGKLKMASGPVFHDI